MKGALLAVHRLLLRCHPRPFRERAGRELDRVARQLLDDAAARGRAALLRAGGRLVVDAARALPGAWVDELLRGGPAEPRREAGMLDAMRVEVKQALRRIRRSPGYAAAAVATLGLGIGATTAIWAVVDAALLRPLPYEEADRLVVVTSTRSGEEISVAYPDLMDWRERTRRVEGPAGFVSRTYNLTGDGDAARLRGQAVTSDLFAILGVAPVLGRGFEPAEDRPGAAPVAVLSHALWQVRFGGDADVLGRTLLLNDVPFTVVGVMPPGFAFPDGIVYGSADLWVPFGAAAEDDWSTRRSHPGIVSVARLADGAGLEAARAELAGIAADLAVEHPETNGDEGVRVRGALDAMVGDLRGSLGVLLAAVALLLLIACANVANLSLVRVVSRRREIAMRAALGAGRARIVCQVLVESLVLAFLGGVAGLLIARAGIGLAGSMLEDLPRLDALSLDGRVLAFAAVVSLGSALLFGTFPALRSASDARGRLRAAAGTRVSGLRLRGGFVVAQVALALVLLIAAGVLVRSFAAMRADAGGIRAEGVLTFTMRLPAARYEGAPTVAFYDALFDAIADLPGVRSVGAISTLPFSGAGAQSGMGLPGATREEEVRTDVNVVTTDYFEAMGVEIIRGRSFSSADREGAPYVVVVDDRFARRFWPDGDAIGRRVQGWGLADAEVVGVARHVKNYGVTAESREELYMPHAQRPFLVMHVIVRTAEPGAAFEPITGIVRRLDPDLPVYNLRRMTDVVAGTVATPRLAAFLSAAFAVLATVLAAIGLYGVIAYGVNLRLQEIGTRMAMGARPGQVVRMVAGHALRLSALGVVLGCAGAGAFSRLLENMVFGVSARDPAVFLSLPALLLLVALAAGAIPARRAARVSPMQALRAE